MIYASAAFCSLLFFTNGARRYTIIVRMLESAQPAGYAATMGIIVFEIKFAIINI